MLPVLLAGRTKGHGRVGRRTEQVYLPAFRAGEVMERVFTEARGKFRFLHGGRSVGMEYRSKTAKALSLVI